LPAWNDFLAAASCETYLTGQNIHLPLSAGACAGLIAGSQPINRPTSAANGYGIAPGRVGLATWSSPNAPYTNSSFIPSRLEIWLRDTFHAWLFASLRLPRCFPNKAAAGRSSYCKITTTQPRAFSVSTLVRGVNDGCERCLLRCLCGNDVALPRLVSAP